MKTSLLVAAALVSTSLLAGCGEESSPSNDATGNDSSSAAPAAVASPTAIPASSGSVSTATLVTVLDDGDGPELCTAAADSLPPQCEGPALEGFSWDDHPEHESRSGTTWGSFHLTGTWDGSVFTVTDAIPAALYDPIAGEPEEPLGTPCADPAGGWKVVDGSKTNFEAMDAAFTAASALPDLAMVWMDQGMQIAQVDPTNGNNPRRIIINVAVTGDVAVAEAAVREVWGGKLCVSQATMTQIELQEIADQLATVPGSSGVGSQTPDTVDLGVLYDDGSIQAWADEEFGAGVVKVTSSLVPAES